MSFWGSASVGREDDMDGVSSLAVERDGASATDGFIVRVRGYHEDGALRCFWIYLVDGGGDVGLGKLQESS